MLGSGIIKGMFETAKNLVGSYHDPERLVTVQYPEQRLKPQENARNFPFLVFDGEDPMQGLRCVACQICEKECPPKCIYIIKDTTKKPDHAGKLQFQAKKFDIDISVCMSCQICVEVCPFDAIKMDRVYELSTYDRFEPLLLTKPQLAKPNDYYRSIHPTEAAEVDERLALDRQKAEAKAKVDAEAKAKALAAVAVPPKQAVETPNGAGAANPVPNGVPSKPVPKIPAAEQVAKPGSPELSNSP